MKPVLIMFELGRMGEATMSLPFVRAALEGYDVYVSCTTATAPLYEMVLPGDRILSWSPPWLATEDAKYDWQAWQELSRQSYVARIKEIRAEIAVSVSVDARVHWLMAMSGAKKRVGFGLGRHNFFAHHLPWRKRELRLAKALSLAGAITQFRPLLNISLERRHEKQHHVACWQQIAQALLLPWRDAPPWLAPPVATFPGEVQRTLEEARESGQPVWLAHAGARLESQRWPMENFDRVLREELQAKGARVILLDSPETVWFGTLKHTFASCRASGIQSIFALIAQVDAVLCNHTGIAHVAAALGKPVVAISTSNSPEWYGPWGNLPRTVRRDVCRFHPCVGRCIQTSFVCRDGITAEMVSKSVRQLQEELLARRGVTPA